MINQLYITSVKLLKQGNATLELLPEFDLKLGEERYKEAVKRVEENDKSIREGITDEVQALFDSLAKL